MPLNMPPPNICAHLEILLSLGLGLLLSPTGICTVLLDNRLALGTPLNDLSPLICHLVS